MLINANTYTLPHTHTITPLIPHHAQLYVVMGTHETGAFIHLADKPSEALFVWIAHSVHLVCGTMALTLILSLLSSPLQMSHEVISTHQTALGQSSPSPSETTWWVHCDNTPSPAVTPPSFHSPPLPPSSISWSTLVSPTSQ